MTDVGKGLAIECTTGLWGACTYFLSIGVGVFVSFFIMFTCSDTKIWVFLFLSGL